MAYPKSIGEREEGKKPGSRYAWAVLCAALLGAILVPFALFGSQIETWTAGFLADGESGRFGFALPLILGGLLAADIVLPVPSSIISTGAGMLLGFAGGMLTSFCGMMLGALIGYRIGIGARGALESRFFSRESVERFQALAKRAGAWGLVLARPVPVLAEASLFFAGMSRMPLRRFLPLVALSNLGLSAVYAAVGTYAATVDSFLLAFAGAIALPLIGLALTYKRR